MRFIHTSDWHLGQALHNFERSFEHQCFLDWLLDRLVAEQADALLISGDVFDTANPSAAALKQFYRFLQQAKVRVPHLSTVIIAGNHDSPGRLEAPGPLLETVDATVIGFVPRGHDGEIDVRQLLIPLKNRRGDIAAWALAVPFLRPGDVPRVDGSADPYHDGITLLYSRALAIAQQLRQPGQALIALGHCHMVGGQISSDSERPIVIGGSEALPSNLFEAQVAYAALGHLHLAQCVGGQNHLRYCGSPLPMSFAEVAYPHQVLLINLKGDAIGSITSLMVPRAVNLLRVPARPEPLPAVLAALKALVVPPQADPKRYPYLEVRVLLDAPEPGLRNEIEAALTEHAVRLAKIETSFAVNVGTTGAVAHTSLDALEQLQPGTVFDQLYRSKYSTDTPAALNAAFAELLLADEVGGA